MKAIHVLPLLPTFTLSAPLDPLQQLLHKQIDTPPRTPTHMPSPFDELIEDLEADEEHSSRWDVPINFKNMLFPDSGPEDFVPVVKKSATPFNVLTDDPYLSPRQNGGFAAGQSGGGSPTAESDFDTNDRVNWGSLSAWEAQADPDQNAPQIQLDIFEDDDDNDLSDRASYNSQAIHKLELAADAHAAEIDLPDPIDIADYINHNYQKTIYQGNLNSLAAMTNKFMDQYNLASNSGKQHLQKVMAMDCYGCWCNRLQNYKRSKGLPVDDFDKICKSHTQAYECMEIDAEQDRNGEVCRPSQVQEAGYKFSLDIVHNSNTDGSYNLQVTCDASDDGAQNWCSQRTCEADIQYLTEFLELSLAGKFIDFDRFGQSGHGGSFEVESNCGTEKAKLHLPVKQCCGKYPKRRVYRTDVRDGGYRQCCDTEGGDNVGQTSGKVFFPDRQVCCGAHGVQDGGECTYYQ